MTNLSNLNHSHDVLPSAMKKILMLTASLLAWPLFTSCTEYSSYGYSSGSSGGYANSSYGYSQSYAPLQVGFISTSYDRWAYDPYRRSYYDRSVNRYYNSSSRNYYSASPRRYSTAHYPSGYRRGSQISCPTYLPRHSNHGHSSHGRVAQRESHGRTTPVIHGSSRSSDRSRSIQEAARYNTRARTSSSSSSSRGSSSRQPTPTVRRQATPQPTPTIRRQATPQPTRRIETPRQVTRPTRIETIRTTPSRSQSVRSKPAPVVRSQPTVRRQPAPTRSAPVTRQPAPSRSTTKPSRSSGKARQRTR